MQEKKGKLRVISFAHSGLTSLSPHQVSRYIIVAKNDVVFYLFSLLLQDSQLLAKSPFSAPQTVCNLIYYPFII